MNIDIPLDGTNVNEVTTDKDAMSLLIMRHKELLYLMLDTFYIQVDYIPETSVFGRSLSVGVGFSYFY